MTAADRTSSGSPALDDLVEAAVVEARGAVVLPDQQLELLVPFLRQYYRFVAPEDVIGCQDGDRAVH